jgi:hypothetical protein
MLLPSDARILAGWPIQALFWLEWVNLLLGFVHPDQSEPGFPASLH